MSNQSKPKLPDFNRIHFIGIGGIGMSALARLCLHEGKEVSGSDRSASLITEALVAEGISLFPLQAKENITKEISLVVYTEAMPKDHEELVAARELGIPTMNYFEALGMVANEYFVVAVAGSHGKTTTTAMLIDVFEAAGLDPTAVVGSLRAKTKSNYRAGKSKYFIVEACEYRRDFLSLQPDILVITNIEHEHVDYYKDLEAVQTAFRELAQKVPDDGYVIANLTDTSICPVIEGLTCGLIDYRKFFDPLLLLQVPGLHNQMNAAAVAGAAEQVGIVKDVTKIALQNFKGTWRRFEYKGEVNGAKVYDDYGHHPTEINATLEGAREMFPERKITLVFQPHTYSRVAELFEDFVVALGEANTTYLVPIYAAREENIHNVSSRQIVTRLKENEKDAECFETFDEVIDRIRESVTEEDLILVMGAGDVTKVTEMLME